MYYSYRYGNRISILIYLLLLLSALPAQEVKNQWMKPRVNAEIGYIGVWLSMDKFISKKVSLRSELGLDSGFFGGSLFVRNGFVSGAVANIETRLYYSTNKRKENFFLSRYYPGGFVSLKVVNSIGALSFSNRSGFGVPSYTHLVLNWGLSKHITDRTFYQLGIGVGPKIHHLTMNRESDSIDANLLIRLGLSLF